MADQKGPLDPAMGDLVSKMNAMLGDVNARLDEQEQYTTRIEGNMGKITDELRKGIKVLTDQAAAYKILVKQAKEYSLLSEKDLDNVEDMRDKMKKLVELHRTGLRVAKEGSKEYEQMSKGLAKAEQFLEKIAGKTKFAAEEATELRDIFGEASKNVVELDKRLGSLSRHGAALKGLGGILSSLGISGGRTIERKVDQIQAIKKAVRDSRETRGKAVFKHMSDKRGKAMEEGTGKGYTFGADEEGAKGRGWLAEKMGFKRGSPKYDSYAKGELNMARGEEAGEAYKSTMSTGAGPIEGMMETFETGIEGLMTSLEGMLLPLAVVAGAIYLLIKVFDTFAEQNKNIEKNLGQGGLFTQPGMGAGQAFMRARFALNPNLSERGVALGATMERNTAMGGAMTGAGYNVSDSFAMGAQDTANQQPGSGGAFMKGNLGEFQRIVMGASRVGGLSDEQGAENLIKLLTEYRQTMAGSEDFMIHLNKDTAAAGISTTKYLKIIDEVSSHFDRMGKSLEEVTGVMRELSRYGAVSGESLKDMMDFLQQGPTTEGNLPQNIFAQMTMPKELLTSSRSGEQAAVKNAVENANMELKRLGLGEIAGGDTEKLRKMTPDQIRAEVGQKRQDAMNIKDSGDRQQVNDALKKVTDQLLHQRTVGGGAMGRGAGAMLYGEDLVQRSATNFSKLDTVTKQFGASVEDFISGNLSAEQMIGIKKMSSMMDFDPIKAIGLLQQESQNRIRTATTTQDPADRKKLIKQLLTEINRKPGGLKMSLAGSQWEGMEGRLDDVAAGMADNGKDAAKALSKNADTIAGSVDTQVAVQDKMRLEQRAGTLQQRSAMDQAADIGKNTQTVEDILKNVFKPLLVDLLFSLEFIARTVAKFTGQSFDVNKKQVHEDMKVIPGAIKDLEGKTKDLIDQNDKLQAKKDKDGVLSPDDQKTFAENSDAIDKNNKTMAYLNDSLTVGVKTGTEQDVLQKTLSGLQKYKEGKGGAVSAPTAKDLEPSMVSKITDTALAGAGPGGWLVKALASAVKDGLQSMGGTTSYYNATINQAATVTDGPDKSKENAGSTVQAVPTTP